MADIKAKSGISFMRYLVLLPLSFLLILCVCGRRDIRYVVYMDEHGDTQGNYTLIGRQPYDKTHEHGLYPVGVFRIPENVNQSTIPVSEFSPALHARNSAGIPVDFIEECERFSAVRRPLFKRWQMDVIAHTSYTCYALITTKTSFFLHDALLP